MNRITASEQRFLLSFFLILLFLFFTNNTVTLAFLYTAKVLCLRHFNGNLINEQTDRIETDLYSNPCALFPRQTFFIFEVNQDHLDDR